MGHRSERRRMRLRPFLVYYVAFGLPVWVATSLALLVGAVAS